MLLIIVWKYVYYHLTEISLRTTHFFVWSIHNSVQLGRGRACILLLMNLRGERNTFSGSGCGSVGRAVASNTRGPQFESGHRQNLYWTEFTVDCNEKKKKRGREWPVFIKRNTFNIRKIEILEKWRCTEKVCLDRHVQIFDLDFVSFKRRRQEQQQPLKGFTKHQRHKAYKHPIFGQNSKRIYYVGINKKSQIWIKNWKHLSKW